MSDTLEVNTDLNNSSAISNDEILNAINTLYGTTEFSNLAQSLAEKGITVNIVTTTDPETNFIAGRDQNDPSIWNIYVGQYSSGRYDTEYLGVDGNYHSFSLERSLYHEFIHIDQIENQGYTYPGDGSPIYYLEMLENDAISRTNDFMKDNFNETDRVEDYFDPDNSRIVPIDESFIPVPQQNPSNGTPPKSPINPITENGVPVPDSGNPTIGGLEDIWDSAKTSFVPTLGYDPLVLDIDGDGIELVTVDSADSVYWDVNEDGLAARSGWITGGDGFLAIDLNANGTIDGQSELFGNETTDGFTALSAYDTNTDNIIDANDTQFGDLLVWIDANSNAISEVGELYTLASLGITNINLSATITNYDVAGNNISHEASFTINGQSQTIANVLFNNSHMDTVYVGDYTLDVRTLFLPTLRGYGELQDLHIAMSGDETLLNMVSEIATADTNTLFSAAFDIKAKVIDIFYRWADVENVATDSRGTLMDARKIEFMEEFFGEEWSHSTDGVNVDEAAVAEDLNFLFDRIIETISNHILVQTSANVFYGEGSYYDLNAGDIVGTNYNSLFVVGSETDSAAQNNNGLNDVYVVSPDTGTESIIDAGGTDTILFAGVTATDLRFERDGYDLKIVHPNGVITVTNQYKQNITRDQNNYEGYKIETIRLEDGTEIDLLSNMTFEGSDQDDNVYGINGADHLFGYNGNDYLYGEFGSDTLIGGLGDDYLNGYDGNDIYIWSTGDGNDTITENSYNRSGEIDTLRLHNVTEAQIRYELISDGGNYHLLVHIDNETIQIDKHFNKYQSVQSVNEYDAALYMVEFIELDDSTIIDLTGTYTFSGTSASETITGLKSRGDILYGYDGDDNINADGGADTLIGGLGDDYLNGGSGDDVYEWAVGDGNDSISEGGYSSVSDTLRLHNVTESQIRYELVSDGGNYHLLVHIDNETIQINKHFNKYQSVQSVNEYDAALYMVEFIELDDSTIINLTGTYTFSGTSASETITGLKSRGDILYGYGGDDNIIADGGADTLIGGLGNDNLQGGSGDDIYEWTVGDGNDSINERGGNETLYLHGVDAEDIRFERYDTAYDYNLKIHIGSEVITVYSHFDYKFTGGTEGYSTYTDTYYTLETLVLDDGTTYDLKDGLFTLTGTSAGENIYGLPSADIIVGLEGDDSLYGYGGDDTLIGGNGSDFMRGYTGADTFVLTNNIASSDVDTIYDFTRTQSDQIDLSDFLQGIFNATTDDITDYVEITTSGSNSLLKVDIDGGADNFVTIATLTNVTGLTDEQDLFDDGYLIIKQAGNNTPAAQDDLFSTNEDTVVSGNLLNDNGNGVDSDADGHSLHLRSETITTEEGGTVVINSNGTFTYTPLLNFYGQDSFQYVLLDNYGGYATGTAYINITSINDAPTAQDDSFAGAEDENVYGNLFDDNGNGIDYDPEGDSFSASAGTFSTTQGGSITIQANGDFIYTPTIGFYGSDSYTYSITDSNSLTSTAIVSFLIEDVAYNLIDGTSSGETIYGTTDSDLINGQEGNDNIYADQGDDKLVGGLGNDTLRGEEGNDIYEWTVGDGNDSIYENGGNDTIKLHNVVETNLRFTYDRSNYDLKIHIGSETITLNDHFRSDYQNNTAYDYNQVEKIQLDDGTNINLLNGLNFEGTSSGEVLYGLNADNVIYGHGGNDTIYTYTGNDTLIGGTGNDNLRGDAGDDTYEWSVGDGNDTIYENGGADTLLLHGVTINDLRYINDRNHYDLKIHIGSEVIIINDHFRSDYQNNTAYDYNQVETLKLDDGTEVDLLGFLPFEGTSSGETIYGTNTYNEINGYEGNDALYGYNGNDIINGGSGADNIYGGDGNDTITGDIGNDNLRGETGDDTYLWTAGDGNDTIHENGGVDTLRLHNVLASDIRFIYDRSYYDLKIHIGSETITLNDHFRSDYQNNTAFDYNQVETILLDDETSIDLTQGLTLEGTSSTETLYGLNVDDLIYGYGGNDNLYGYGGNDTLIGGAGNDSLRGEVGDDTYEWHIGDGNDTIYENGGADTLKLHGVNENDLRFVYDRSSNDLKVHIGNETVIINDHFRSDYQNNTAFDYNQVETILLDDETSIDLTQGLTLEGTSSTETLYGLNVDDLIYGYGGNDSLYSYNGNDVLHGGSGNDYISGGSGADTFVFENTTAANGIDTISDFSTTDGDMLDFSQLLDNFDPLTDAISDFIEITDSGSHSTVKVDVDGGANNFVQVATLNYITGLTDEDQLYTDGTLIV